MKTRNIIFIWTILIVAASIIAQSAPSADVVAKIDDENVTISEIEAFNPDMAYRFKEISSNSENMNRDLNRRGLDDREKEYRLEEVIKNRLMMKEAKAAGLEKDPDFKAEMATFENYVLLNLYYEKVIKAGIVPTEEELRAEYEQEGRYTRPAMARVITVWSQNEQEANEAAVMLKGLTKENDPESKFQIEDIHILEEKQIEEMHKMTEEINSSSNNNNIDPMMEMSMALVDAKPGDIVGPKGNNGNFMTMKVIEKTPAGKIPFGEVKEDIKRQIIEREFERTRDEKERELRKKSVVTIYYENLDKVFK